MQRFNIVFSAIFAFLLAIAQVEGSRLNYGHRHHHYEREHVNVHLERAVTPSTTTAFSWPTPSSGTAPNCITFQYFRAADTCDTFIARYASLGLTQAKLTAWNTLLKSDCSGLADIRGHNICVAVSTATTTTTPFSWPTPSSGTAPNCITFQYFRAADTCDTFIARYASLGLTQAKLTAWNTLLKSDCSGLADIRGHNICVAVSTATTTTTVSAWPTPSSGTAPNCITLAYFRSTDTCSTFLARYASTGLTQANLIKWNTLLKSDCSGLSDIRLHNVCIAVSATKTTTTSSSAFAWPTPSSGTAPNCVTFAYFRAADDCSTFVARYASTGLTQANLIKWNTLLKPDCSGLADIRGHNICISAPATTTTKTTTKSTTKSTTTSASPWPTPSSGTAPNCITFAYFRAADDCSTFVARYASTGLTQANLMKWNTLLKSDCSGLSDIRGHNVCIAVSATTTTTSRTTTTTSPAKTGYWMDAIKHQGYAPYAGTGYQVYRNVKDFGAKGDGVTDDTAAINNATSWGSRCGNGCDSSTTKPALVYFPGGTYLISSPILPYYNTHMVGDPTKLPRIKATSGFQGIALIDPDPYTANGQWHTPQNNFYRVVRNFILDTTSIPASTGGTGIHWRVAQATSLQNLVFQSNNAAGTKHQGIWMEDGSGGYMSDLIFNGGAFCAWMGNQQFTVRNITLNNCDTGIYLNWGWEWHFKSVTANNVRVGIDMSQTNGDSPVAGALNVGSVIVADSQFNNVQVAINSTRSSSTYPTTANSLVLDNVSVKNCPIIVGSPGKVKLAGTTGSTTVAMWAQGRQYSQSNQAGSTIQGAFTGFTRPSGLLDSSGKILERSKPNYEGLTADQFLSARTAGCKGDGTTDDTTALQAAITNAASQGKVLHLDYGVYLVSTTIYVPPGSRIMGEVWPLILGSGTAFTDMSNPVPIVQFGRPGDSGFIEGTNFIVGTRGAMKGAILMEWNLASTGDISGLYDVHARVGGFQGSNLDANTCVANPSSSTVNQNCAAAFMLMRIGTTASYSLFENLWLWTADHDLDLATHKQISVYSGRGLLVESHQPIWLYGTASEHNVLYQYQFSSASSVYMGLIQSETPYYQANPVAPLPFSINAGFHDPDYNSICSSVGGTSICKKSYGLRILSSTNILCYGAGLYSFYDNYEQTCLDTESCQTYMVSIENSSNLRLYNINTKASQNILTVNGAWSAKEGDNVNTFAQTVVLFQA
ncbi:hypothetical protein AA313_de0209493 [Arthrobotrys entomopaga]|nr:hypothetical protein AA313_de0209493 [Arthrobotrys entomopaga]